MKVITFSRQYPKNHPKAGQPTLFVEKIWSGIKEDFSKTINGLGIELLNFTTHEYKPKYNTIRAGNRWKVGDKFSPRVWSGLPYRSKQIEFAPPIEIKKIWEIEIVTEDDDGESDWSFMRINGKHYTLYSEEYADDVIKRLAKNDGFSNIDDFYDWFGLDRTYKQRVEQESKIFKGQILCWNENINY